ncbi:ABC transporter permease, partial [uncultured Muribaculum sp.]
NMGNFLVYMTVKDDDQVKALKREVQEIAHKFNTSGGTVEVNLYNQPSSHFEVALRESPTDDFSWSSVIRRNIIILLVLLLIPSLNLSGMIAGRMESRMSEMGIRKSYGAGSGILMKQVLFENFLWTVAGGVIGLAAAWIVLALEREWIFKLFENNPGSSVTDVHLSGEMLFSPAIFGGALVLCLMLNLMSAFIPTWRAMRRPIVTSLYEKR